MKNLKKYFDKYDIPLTQNNEQQLEKYYNYVLEENKKFNLTSITNEEEFIIKHYVDCLLARKYFYNNAKVLDIGSGAGFPAIPLKIDNNSLNITMIDSVDKKIKFLNNTIDLLKLTNICAKHFRIEDFAISNKEKFDICTSRAVASLPTLLEYALPFLKVGGFCVFYKSQKIDEEISIASNSLKILGGEIEEVIHYDLENNDRNIIIVKKIKKSPNGYPRGKNKPKLQPL